MIRQNNAQTSKEDVHDGHQRTELLRAKQDMINRIIQMGEKVFFTFFFSFLYQIDISFDMTQK